MSGPADGPESPGRRRRAGSSPGSARRVPAWVVIPLTVAVGYAVSAIPGAVFGLLAGLALWWSRR